MSNRNSILRHRALCAGTSVVGSIITACASSIALATPANIYNLGTLGGNYSEGRGVNDFGQVAGASRVAGDTFHAFLYSGVPGARGAMADLGTLGGLSSQALGINAVGQLVGFSDFDLARNGNVHAFRFTPAAGGGGTMADLGTLGGPSSTGSGINLAGQVVDGSYITAGNAAIHAFRYTGTPGAGGSMTDLGTLGGLDSRANAINDAGQIVGSSDTGAFPGAHAFLYAAGSMADLGTLGGLSSTAQAINNSGQIAGWSTTSAGETLNRAFLYVGAPGLGAMQDLGTLGGTVSQAFAINNAGHIAGDSVTAKGDQHAFLYSGTPSTGGSMIDLDQWLDASNPVEGAKWTLMTAYGLSDNGLVTGIGLYDDGVTSGTRAFLLDASALPEPGGLWLVVACAPALVRRRRASSAGDWARRL